MRNYQTEDYRPGAVGGPADGCGLKRRATLGVSAQAQIDAFFAQLESLYRWVNAFAVSFSALASFVAL